jgi:hypothetical protein
MRVKAFQDLLPQIIKK